MTEKMGPYVVSRCPCGQRGCEDWHASSIFAVRDGAGERQYLRRDG